MIAALYVETGGVYYGLPDVDTWDDTRDARLYAGPWPVVAHPPCERWCGLARLNERRYGHRVGDDGDCFASALAAVRQWGGVLEHPAQSLAWPAHDLLRPTRGTWQRSLTGDWVVEVAQSAYGHLARKLTWLLYCGDAPPPEVSGDAPAGTHQVSWGRPPGGGYWRPPLGKRAAKATPLRFRDLLLAMARGAR